MPNAILSGTYVGPLGKDGVLGGGGVLARLSCFINYKNFNILNANHLDRLCVAETPIKQNQLDMAKQKTIKRKLNLLRSKTWTQPSS